MVIAVVGVGLNLVTIGTEQLRKLGNFIDYYLDKFNLNGVFIRHKQ